MLEGVVVAWEMLETSDVVVVAWKMLGAMEASDVACETPPPAAGGRLTGLALVDAGS